MDVLSTRLASAVKDAYARKFLSSLCVACTLATTTPQAAMSVLLFSRSHCRHLGIDVRGQSMQFSRPQEPTNYPVSWSISVLLLHYLDNHDLPISRH